MTERQEYLLGTGRWEWLGETLGTWYAEPLAAGDGSTLEEIAAAEERVGPLPAVLREWFELVGARLRDVQDYPATPARLRVDDEGCLVAWHENQGCWDIRAVPGPDGRWDDDPVCVGNEDYEFGPVPLSVALHAMTLSETLAGAWSTVPYSDVLEGPLGLLGDQVRGGYTEDEGDRHVLADYPELPLPANPSFYPPRGDATTVLRADDLGIIWMTATDDVFATFASHVDLDPPGGEHAVVLTVATPAGAKNALLRTLRRSPTRPSAKLVQRALGDLGRVTETDGGARRSSAQDGTDWVRFTITTRSPDAVVAALLSVVADQLDAVEIATRPVRLALPRVVHPTE